MEHFPIFLDLKGRRVVVIGGSDAAARKIELLIQAGARPAVIAPTVSDEIAAWARGGRCVHEAPALIRWSLDFSVLVVVATEDDELARTAAAAAQDRGILVNVVDRPELSSFIMPAILDRSPVVVAISTGGASPTLAQMLRSRIEAALPAGIERLAHLARSLRPLVQEFLADAAERRAFWRRALASPAANLALSGREDAARADMVGQLRDAANRTSEPTRAR